MILNFAFNIIPNQQSQGHLGVLFKIIMLGSESESQGTVAQQFTPLNTHSRGLLSTLKFGNPLYPDLFVGSTIHFKSKLSILTLQFRAPCAIQGLLTYLR